MQYKVKQRLYGVALALCGIVSAAVTGDGTAALLLVPFGIYAALTRENLLNAPEQVRVRPTERRSNTNKRRAAGE